MSVAAARNGLPCVEVVASDEPYAFTYALLAPRVVISSGLLSVATADELDAVLAHEHYHVASFDPLKTLIARVIPAAFYFLPALGHIASATSPAGSWPLTAAPPAGPPARLDAGALYKTAATPSPPLVASAAAMSGDELLDVRITQLEAGREPPLPRVPRRTATLTLAGLAATTVGVVATITVAASPGTAPMGIAGEVLGAVVCGVVWLVGANLVYGHLAGRR